MVQTVIGPLLLADDAALQHKAAQYFTDIQECLKNRDIFTKVGPILLQSVGGIVRNDAERGDFLGNDHKARRRRKEIVNLGTTLLLYPYLQGLVSSACYDRFVCGMLVTTSSVVEKLHGLFDTELKPLTLRPDKRDLFTDKVLKDHKNIGKTIAFQRIEQIKAYEHLIEKAAKARD